LTVNFDGTGSSDPEGKPLTYSWAVKGDGTFGDATGSTASYTYTTSGVYHPSLRGTDDQGASDTTSVTITAGNTAPVPVIDSPASSLTWRVGDTIPFSGHAIDAQDGTLPASALSWKLVMHHCFTQTDCHEHEIQTINGVASGTVTAPDDEYPMGKMFFNILATSPSSKSTCCGCGPAKAWRSPRGWGKRPPCGLADLGP
ncbi:PKD domain-containing protein, partial [Pseudonocardia sp.]|uniref:PKD domain-containing protein n=1 Tax=Pseudonocardia sp. TaxID=60912 RepID=UPI0031FDF64E